MKMRQSLSDWEQAFVREVTLERLRRDSLRRTTENRARKREADRRHKRGSVRFFTLVLTVVATAAIVTLVMFRVLYLLLA